MACAVLVLCVGCAVAVDEQGAALLAWKATLRGGDALADWKPTDASPCRWTGVTCNADGGVTELSLQYVDLFGGVPANLTALGSTLSRLVLTGANLTGAIPPELGELPALAHLDLSNNALTGPIPAGLCRPGSKLETLYLNSNRLEGALPDAIGNLTSPGASSSTTTSSPARYRRPSAGWPALRCSVAAGTRTSRALFLPRSAIAPQLTMIGLAETSINGPLPASLGRLKNLTTLAIYTALLSGPIPPELGQCTSLENIYLYENALSGSIPAQLGRLKRLTNLLLWQNQLVGIIPPELGSCPGLTVVDLSLNGLTGHIPVSFGNLPALQQLQLSVNKLSGTVPPELARCSNLTDLELDNNQLTGSIPAVLGGLPSLRMLYLWANQLTGTIPPELGRCTSLEALDLSNNALTGPIPQSLFALPRLSKLLLINNNLSGELPPEIGNCTTCSLQYLDLSYNVIGGTLPSDIGMLTSLTKLILSGNRLSGFRAEIALNLSCNSFTGTVPAEFTRLVRLGVLDVSHNQLSGDLQTPSGLQNLVALNISFNGFTGRLPETAFFAKLPASDVEGNPALCLSWVRGRRWRPRARRAPSGAHGDGRAALRPRRPPRVRGARPRPRRRHQRRARRLGEGRQMFRHGTVVRLGVPREPPVERRDRRREEVPVVRRGVRGSVRLRGERAPRVRHRNVVRLLGWAANRRTRLLFYDYLPNGTSATFSTAAAHGRRRHGGAAVVEWEVRLAIAVEYGCMTKITTKSDDVQLRRGAAGDDHGAAAAGPPFGEGQSVVQWVRDHLCRKREPLRSSTRGCRGRPDTQVQEMLQALGIALLCASPRPGGPADDEGRGGAAAWHPTRRQQHRGAESWRRRSGGRGRRGEKWADLKQPISPTKLMAPHAQPAQGQAQGRTSSGSQSLLKNRE
ncbi:unnamed protein product [Miscanthus lutarioriparius]|uniref:Leucine-rich repeat-containing N-terminal plant-type domain-containing protein n=1 Tax=Miscanthus lutarioriparius TaxID=422564 RepID=A0A811S083_9POAL|nr:unnamed protein product [Miscanthus lutarioriparius]